jgi:hypothetical protein
MLEAIAADSAADGATPIPLVNTHVLSAHRTLNYTTSMCSSFPGVLVSPHAFILTTSCSFQPIPKVETNNSFPLLFSPPCRPTHANTQQVGCSSTRWQPEAARRAAQPPLGASMDEADSTWGSKQYSRSTATPAAGAQRQQQHHVTVAGAHLPGLVAHAFHAPTVSMPCKGLGASSVGVLRISFRSQTFFTVTHEALSGDAKGCRMGLKQPREA